MRTNYLKKIIAIALSCLIMTPSGFVIAADNPIAFEDGVRIKTSDFTVAKGFNGAASTPSQKNGGTAISINKGLDFNVVPPKAGIYKLELQHKSGNPSSINIWAGFVENGLKEKIGMEHLTSGASSNNTDDWDEPTTIEGWAWTTMGYAVFPTTSQRTLRLHNDTTVTGSGNGPWTGAIKFTYVEPAQIEGSDIGSVMPRGTDSFAVNYSSELNADRIDEAIISLTDSDGQEIPVNFIQVSELDSKQLVIAIGKSLDYSMEYTLSIDKVADSLGYPIDGAETVAEEIVFTTSDENGDSISDYASVAIDSIELDGTEFTVNGTMTGSMGQGIEGRKVTGTITSPEDAAEAVEMIPVMSGKNGKFAISYTLDDEAPGGLYTFEIGGEYVSSPDTDTSRYVSLSERKTILSMLEDADTYLEVASVMEDHASELGIMELPDYNMIFAEGTDRNKFYSRFADASFKNSDDEYDIKIFKNVYLTNLALEHMSQADDSDVTEHYIDDSVYTVLLGLDTAKYGYLDKEKDNFLNAVSLLNADAFANAEAFGAEFDKLLTKYFLLDKVGYETISLEASSASSKQGQTTEFEIKAKSAIDKVRKIELTISFEDDLDGEYDDFELETELGQCEEIKDLTYEITPQEVTDGVIDIAKISFIPEKLGEGKVKVEGKVTLDNETDYDAVADITLVEYTVEIKEQVKQSIGGGSSSGRGSSGVSFGGASAIVPTPSTNTQQTQVQGKSYKDLASVPWAEEAIVGLYNRQAIAMPEDGMFNPNRTITRAEFIKMVILANYMWRGADLKSDFGDVSKDDWYYEYLVSAVNNGLITGDSEGNFRPTDPITREDICVILARLKNVKNADMNILFADDGEISEYARIAVYYMKEAGIVNGVGDGNFAPKANATRAEAAKIIYGSVQ